MHPGAREPYPVCRRPGNVGQSGARRPAPCRGAGRQRCPPAMSPAPIPGRSGGRAARASSRARRRPSARSSHTVKP
eukprot:scaffold3607_cov114-Isochrysis_galbana.AAC.6